MNWFKKILKKIAVITPSILLTVSIICLMLVLTIAPMQVLADEPPTIDGDGYVSIDVELNEDVPEYLKDPTYTDPTIKDNEDCNYEIDISGNKVIVGDVKTDTFDQTVLYNRWGGESWFSVKYRLPEVLIGTPTLISTASTLVDEKVLWDNDATAINIYALDDTETDADYGAVEYEIILKQPPKTNVLYFDILSSPDVEFYYQPALTSEQIKNGTSRPDNVIGSYAVYSTTKSNQVEGQTDYATGKLGHIYRPQAVDNNGWKVWGELLIEDGVMTVTLPWEYLQQADYPIRHAAGSTFGYTSDGGSSTKIIYLMGYKATPTATGTASSITAWLHAWGSGKFQCALYKGTALQTPQTEEFDNWSSDTPDNEEKTFDFTNGASITKTEYVIAIWAERYASVYIGSDTVTDAGVACFTTETYSDWCSTLGSSCCDDWYDYDDNTRFSIYTTTAAAATANITNTPSSEALGVVSANSTYYADGSAPSNPVGDGDCTFTITNSSGAAVDIDVKITNFTGGVGWTLASAVASNTVKMTTYYSGQNPASGVVLTTSDQEFLTSLADNATKKWDFKLETGIFTDGVQKSSTITLTASLS